MVYGRWYMVQTSSSTSVALHGHFSVFLSLMDIIIMANMLTISTITRHYDHCKHLPPPRLPPEGCRFRAAKLWRIFVSSHLFKCSTSASKSNNSNLHICLRLGSHKAWTLAIASAVTLSASIPDQDGDDKGDHQLMMMIIILIKMVIIEVIFNWLW